MANSQSATGGIVVVEGLEADGEEARLDLTARLCEWIARVHPGEGADAGETASRIARGLCRLTGAEAAAVLARRPGESELLLLATTSVSSELLLETGEEDAPVHFSARHLLAVLPTVPFAVSQAEPHLQVFLQQLWDFTRETTSTQPGTEHSPEALQPPDFMVPLRAGETGDSNPVSSMGDGSQTEVVGLALLWMNSQLTLPAAMQSVLEAVGHQAGGWLSQALRLERLGRSYHQLVRVVARAVDSRVPEETERSEAIAYYAGLIGREMGLSGVEIERIELAGLLHDIGKMAVPDRFICKKTPLTPEERDMVRRSLTSGAEWLQEVEGLSEVAAIVRHQGERYDGKGYPDGLQGEDIPIGARILAAALRFAAMTNTRSDRRAMSVVGGGLQSLYQESGNAFDPLVVETFLRAMGREAGNADS